jgi:hypothetical protein
MILLILILLDNDIAENPTGARGTDLPPPFF